jgi:hypothetical protein
MWISKRKFQKLSESIEFKDAVVKELEKQLIQEKEKNAQLMEEALPFKFESNRPILIFKLGDRAKGWIPNKEHERALIKKLKDAHVDDKYNIVIYHYGVEVSKVD